MAFTKIDYSILLESSNLSEEEIDEEIENCISKNNWPSLKKDANRRIKKLLKRKKDLSSFG